MLSNETGDVSAAVLQPVEQAVDPLDVVIVGSGFSGLGAAIQARRCGWHRLRILEKGDDIGGVWRENTYPGAACDVPWHLYSFSFYKWFGFSRRYPHQPEILDYMRCCAKHFGLYDLIEFGAQVREARWDEAGGCWHVEAEDGRWWRARVLVAGVGQLSRPAWPNILGRKHFGGASYHSAEWDHDVPLEGRRVAVIGTGASAIQFVPEVAKVAGHLTVFQRSAPYLLPRLDGDYGLLNRLLFRYVPGYDRPFRYCLWKLGEVSTDAFDQADNAVARIFRYVTRRHLERQVPDPELRAKVTPDYPIGCKRILFSSDYYPALQRDNVTLETAGIRAINATGIETVDGRQHDADVLIYATGFRAADFLAPMHVVGRDGAELQERWRHGAKAYLGMTVPGFPNFFVMYGPNTNLGGNSIIYMIECQMRYLDGALRHLKRVRALAVRQDVFARFNEELQRRLSQTVWAAGCSSWYQTADGRITNNWPGKTYEYYRRTRHLDPADYEIA